MFPRNLKVSFFLALVCFPSILRADFVTYRFSFTDGSGNATSVIGASVSGFSVGAFSIGNSDSNITGPINGSSPSTGYTGATGGNNIGLDFQTGDLNPNSSGYISLLISNNSGATQYLTDLAFGTRSTGTGPANFSLRLGDFSTGIANATNSTDSVWRLVDLSFSSQAIDVGSTELRLYGFGGTGSSSTINGRFDDIAVTFNATAVPEPTSIVLITVAGGAAMGFRFVRRKSNVAKKSDRQ